MGKCPEENADSEEYDYEDEKTEGDDDDEDINEGSRNFTCVEAISSMDHNIQLKLGGKPFMVCVQVQIEFSASVGKTMIAFFAAGLWSQCPLVICLQNYRFHSNRSLWKIRATGGATRPRRSCASAT